MLSWKKKNNNNYLLIKKKTILFHVYNNFEVMYHKDFIISTDLLTILAVWVTIFCHKDLHSLGTNNFGHLSSPKKKYLNNVYFLVISIYYFNFLSHLSKHIHMYHTYMYTTILEFWYFPLHEKLEEVAIFLCMRNWEIRLLWQDELNPGGMRVTCHL